MDAQAISVMSQIKDIDNPISLILAETLLGLDVVFHGGESQNFLRSPLTLQIWFIERLDMITKPTSGSYGPCNFLSRTVIKTECQTEGEVLEQEIQYLNSMGLLLVEVPTPSTEVSRIRPHLPC